MYIKRSDAIKAMADRVYEIVQSEGCKDTYEECLADAEKTFKDIPSAEKQGENATRCYEFLKTKLGESIVDSKKEFESWYERMVWHVKECDRLAREPKQGEWTPCSERLPSECDVFLITWTASVTNEPLLAFAEYEPDDFLVSGGKWYLEDDMREFKDVDVIAWMPLPKPWKGADDE